MPPTPLNKAYEAYHAVRLLLSSIEIEWVENLSMDLTGHYRPVVFQARDLYREMLREQSRLQSVMH